MSASPVSVRVTETLCVEQRPDPCGMVIFGASGDLAQRKILPSLFRLSRRGLLPERFFVVGVARTPMTDEAFRERVRVAVGSPTTAAEGAAAEAFCRLCSYVAGDYADGNLHARLADELARLAEAHGTRGNVLHYLSTPPNLCEGIVEQLAARGLTAQPGAGGPWRRVIIEKPFGQDLASATALDRSLHRWLAEDQVYRIDHYLGKDTVQNVLMLRFANTVFEPLWNRQYVDHVQVTVAESLGVGSRAGYYDQAGCLRDMFQNHVLQLLALVAMEAPVSFQADRVRDEKLKALRSVVPFRRDGVTASVVRAQYTAGEVDGAAVPGYVAEPGVAPGSRTETYAAMRLRVANWRWEGVPFYLRSGKRLARRMSEIAIAFRRVPHSIFEPLLPEHLEPNALVLNVQPEEGVSLVIQAKRPGPKLCLDTLSLQFRYRDVFGAEPPEAYERLLLDGMLGDQTLFARHDHIELSWALLTPVLEAWAEVGGARSTTPLYTYPAGSWGPAAADELLARDGRQWRTP